MFNGDGKDPEEKGDDWECSLRSEPRLQFNQT